MGREKPPKISSRRKLNLATERLGTKTNTIATRKEPTKLSNGLSPFQIDTEQSGTQIPTITKLLNRRKLSISKPEVPAGPEYPHPEVVQSDLVGEITQASIESSLVVAPAVPPAKPEMRAVKSAPVAQPAAVPATQVRLTARTDRSRGEKPLTLWSKQQLQKAKDPLGRALNMLLDRGANSALFLCMVPPGPGAKVPLFVGTAIGGAVDRQALWTGLRWNPELFPELWNTFVRAGFLELGPPSANTNQTSHRNLLRFAFGLKNEEFLLLLRAGPPNACRGVLALISRQSLVAAATPAVVLMNQPIQKQAA